MSTLNSLPTNPNSVCQLIRLCILLTLTVVSLSGCGGGSGGGGGGGGGGTAVDAGAGGDDGGGQVPVPDDMTVASIEITPGTVLLTEMLESQALTAQAFNADAQLIPDVVFTWASSDSGDVSVDESGVITSQVSTGSAQIMASAGGIQSQPVVVLVAMPVPNALIIDDGQVVTPPTFVDPNADLEVGVQFIVTLNGDVVPEVGETIVGTGEHPIGGVVVSSDLQADGSVTVIYELVPMDELFSSLVIDESFDLSTLPVELVDELVGLYDMEILENGRVLLTLKPDAPPPSNPTATSFVASPKSTSALAATPETTSGLTANGASSSFRLGIFKCEASVSPPFSLTANPGTIEVDRTATLSVRWRLPADSIRDVEMVRISGEISAKFKAELTLTSQLTAEVKCEAPAFKTKTILFPGVLVIVSPTIALGPTFALGGTIQAQTLGIELNADARANGFMEVRCPASIFDCSPDASFTAPSPNADYEIKIPDPNALLGIMIQPKLSAGILGAVTFGLPLRFTRVNRLLGKLTLEAVKAKLELAQTADLAFVSTQVADEMYSSQYKLAYEWEVGPGADLDKALKILSRLFGPIDLTVTGDGDLANSPTALTVTADVDSFQMLDLVEFLVNLDPANTDYPFVGYNVESVSIYRKTGGVPALVGTDTPDASGDLNFRVPWSATSTGSISDGFYAFVRTKALPELTLGTQIFGKLEIAKVTGSTSCADAVPVFSSGWLNFGEGGGVGTFDGQADPSDSGTIFTGHSFGPSSPVPKIDVNTGIFIEGGFRGAGRTGGGYGFTVESGSVITVDGETSIQMTTTFGEFQGILFDNGDHPRLFDVIGTDEITFDGTYSTFCVEPDPVALPGFFLGVPVWSGTHSLNGNWSIVGVDPDL